MIASAKPQTDRRYRVKLTLCTGMQGFGAHASPRYESWTVESYDDEQDALRAARGKMELGYYSWDGGRGYVNPTTVVSRVMCAEVVDCGESTAVDDDKEEEVVE